MQEEIRIAWTSALRSGTRAQGRHYLKQVDLEGNTEYCCLGVLAEVCSVLQSSGGYQSGPVFFLFPDWDSKESQTPNLEWCESLGIDAKLRNRLMEMNDGTDMSEPVDFSSIADYIDTVL